MTFDDFDAQGVTGSGESRDLLFRSEVTGPQGTRYELLREKHHLHLDVEVAKAYILNNFDAVAIRVIHEE